MRFKVGDEVMAKWPGSALYYRAKVTKIDLDEQMAEVLFEDGTDMEVPIPNLASERAFTRKKSKSPSRRRSRSRSPGRSPGRRTRQSKVANDKKAVADKSLTSTSSSSEETKITRAISSSTRSAVKRSTRYEEKEETEVGQKVTTRQYEAEVVVTKMTKTNDVPTQVKTAVKFTSNSGSVTEPKKMSEFGGPFGVFFMYLTCPLLPLALMTACDKHQCELQKLKLSDIPLKLSSYYDRTGALIIAGYMLFHALIYALPFGYIIDGPKTPSGKKTQYRISAFYTLFFSMVAFFALKFSGYEVSVVLDKMFPMMAMCTVMSYVLNILIQIKSWSADESELNPDASTGCTIYDMYFGRELHPKFGKYFQFKLYIYRPAMTAWLLFNIIYLQHEFETTGKIRPSLAILAASQIWYGLWAFFLDEAQAVFSFDIKNEGAGFMAVFGNFVMVPFFYTTHCLYLLKHPDTKLPVPALVTVALLIVLGQFLVLISGNQKTRFRQNPYDPSIQSYESIPPSRKGGDRILVSGLWGFVRHPNYLGEIVMGLGFGLACGFKDIFPWLYVIFVAGLLCHRALRDDVRCQGKHGYAWKEYCKRVKYRVIPFVF